MEHTEENLPLAVEKHYNGKIIARASLANPITQSYQSLVILRSKTSKKIILLLEEVPIEFDTIGGKQAWINGFGLLDKTPYMLIDDGSAQSLGIHGYDGSRATLGYSSPLGTPETIYRIRRTNVSSVDGDPFLLAATLGSIYDVPAYGPE